MPFKDKEITARKNDGVVTVTLNRPEALNALTLEMVRLLSAALARWERDADVNAVIITGAGDRAFCAGGDVKAAYTLGMDYRRGETSERSMTLFYAEEYRMNRQLFHFKKPLIAFMDGITMGGGFGVAGPCRFRVATEKTRLAMPETNIGFFTDVGSAWFLNRCPGEAGTYLALTGNAIGGADALWSGLATHYMPQSSLASCADAIEKTAKDKNATAESFASVLSKFSQSPVDAGDLQKNRDCIDRCFRHDSVEAILAALAAEKSEWAGRTAATLESRSPTSMKVTLSHLRKAKAEDFDTIIARDFTLAQHFMKGLDFYEGVRAALVDKDKNPRWTPARLPDISDKDVARHFLPAGFTLDERAA